MQWLPRTVTVQPRMEKMALEKSMSIARS